MRKSTVGLASTEGHTTTLRGGGERIKRRGGAPVIVRDTGPVVAGIVVRIGILPTGGGLLGIVGQLATETPPCTLVLDPGGPSNLNDCSWLTFGAF